MGPNIEERNMTEYFERATTDNIAERPWKISIQKVAKGYVRWSVHSNEKGEAIEIWNWIKDRLHEGNELIEGEEPNIEEGT
jgi:hypothetical protein